MRRALSLQTRLLWAASFALAAFLGVTGYALEKAFTQSALQATRERLRSYVLSYIAGSDITVRGALILPEVPPDPNFERPQSGLYAAVTGPDFEWRSQSALGRQIPFDLSLEPSRTQFDGPLPTNVGGVYRYAEGVAWELGNGKEVKMTFYVAEHESSLKRQINIFRRTLFLHLGGAAGVLLLVQLLMLRWSLRPLR